MEAQRVKVAMALDPGCRKGHGIALFIDGRVIWAGMVKDLSIAVLSWVHTYQVTDLIIEIPVVRQTGQQKGSQKDIIDLALAAGTAVGKIVMAWPTCQVEEVVPEKWKRQIPKDIACHRIKERLTAVEKSCLPAKLTNDILDAIGIGFWKFDRERALV